MAPALTFPVRRREPLLVAPSEPTSNEVKMLSDIDDQEANRFQIPSIQFYRNNGDFATGGRHDPAEVIREALAKALVFYYPLAGRLREGSGRKLMVECTGEGAIFVEADADIRLEDLFGEEEEDLLPPFPYLQELLYDVEGSSGILNCPLVHIQVTRLICGGFIFALRVNHTLCDGQGMLQFANAIGEMARGMHAPTVLPVWKRELLDARDPPNPTFVHDEYDTATADPDKIIDVVVSAADTSVHRSFLFGPQELSALRKRVPGHLRKSSDVEILTACLWKARTASLGGASTDDEEVRVMCMVNSRSKFYPPLPGGYYGNAWGGGTASARADKIRTNPLGYALDLVKKAKWSVTDEYMRSLADFMVAKGRPPLKHAGLFLVSDLTRAGFGDIDFGWGKAAYGGPAEVYGLVVHLLPFKYGIAVPLCLPGPAMERFVGEIESMIKEPTQDNGHVPFIKSSY